MNITKVRILIDILRRLSTLAESKPVDFENEFAPLQEWPKRPRRELMSPTPPSGIYCLDKLDSTDPCNSSVLLAKQAFLPHAGEFESLANFMIHKVKQEKIYGKRVPRKQCTFGPVKYKKYQLFSDESVWPSLVKKCLDFTRRFASALGVRNPNDFSGVHVNYYADGRDSVQKHTDAEDELVRGEPIFSFTFIEGDRNEAARDFTIWKKANARGIDPAPEGSNSTLLVRIKLESGDLLIMRGDMQEFFLHGIEKVEDVEGDLGKVAPRLNLTIRKFMSKEEVARMKKMKRLNAKAKKRKNVKT